MKTLKSFRTLLILSVSAILLNACFRTDPPPMFRIMKFDKPEYTQYVRGEDSVVHIWPYKIPDKATDWTDYAHQGAILEDVSDLDTTGIYIALHNGYYLEYRYLIDGRTIYNLRWSDLTSFVIDSCDYEVLADDGIAESYMIELPRTVKDMDGVVRYVNRLIDDGRLSEEGYRYR